MRPILKSSKLTNVCYDIRGPVMERAKQMEEEGHHIIKLNIGNPATFGFDVPEEILQDVIRNLSDASGYCDSKGLFAARKAIMHYTQEKQIKNVQLDDIFIGNGVSELVVLTMQALLDNGDEVLIPMPDYPLWTAAEVFMRRPAPCAMWFKTISCRWWRIWRWIRPSAEREKRCATNGSRFSSV